MSAESTAGASTTPSVPSDLTPRGRGRRWFRAVTGEFDPEPHEFELICEAARMLDLVDRLREATDNEPLLADGRTNPLLIELRLVRSDLRLLLSQFSWDDDGDTPTSRRARHAANARWSR